MAHRLTDLTSPAIRGPLERHSARRAEHQPAPDQLAGCICGWTSPRPGRQPRRAVGLHIAAAEKRAERLFDAECEPIIKLLTRHKDVAHLAAMASGLRDAVARAAEASDAAAEQAAQAELDTVMTVIGAYAELGNAEAAVEVAYAARLHAQDVLAQAKRDGSTPEQLTVLRGRVAVALQVEEGTRLRLREQTGQSGPSREAVREAVATLQAELHVDKREDP